MATMKAAVIHEAGGPEVLRIESLPIPAPKSGEVLIRVKAFGLNRSELFTRQGHSPEVKFPRVLGIEGRRSCGGGTRGRVSQRRYRRDGDGRTGAAI
jgi:Zn-dependent alcohol dehydrogenase